MPIETDAYKLSQDMVRCLEDTLDTQKNICSILETHQDIAGVLKIFQIQMMWLSTPKNIFQDVLSTFRHVIINLEYTARDIPPSRRLHA